MSAIYDIEVTDIHGKTLSLAEFKNKVMLIVNTASECDYTVQYKELEALYQKYKDQDFVVLGFPCNQFDEQEPGSEQDILSFCQSHYDVSFPLFSKINVNGPNTHPLYQLLKEEAKDPTGGTQIRWNFEKFIVDKKGCISKRIPPSRIPHKLSKRIGALLAQL